MVLSPARARQEYRKLWIILVFSLVVLGGFLLYVSAPLLGSKSTILATQPVDPFDFFRGQYITIRYEINSIPAILGATVGDTVYVVLQEDQNNTARFASSSLEKPSADALFIQGRITYLQSDRMEVTYGIEQYFFERGASFPQRDLTVKIKLNGSGRARISELLSNGEPVTMTYRNLTLTS